MSKVSKAGYKVIVITGVNTYTIRLESDDQRLSFEYHKALPRDEFEPYIDEIVAKINGAESIDSKQWDRYQKDYDVDRDFKF